MPLRSVKMKRFIFGFQRRVWCPKWTPLSSSCFMLTTAIAAFLVCARPPAAHLGCVAGTGWCAALASSGATHPAVARWDRGGDCPALAGGGRAKSTRRNGPHRTAYARIRRGFPSGRSVHRSVPSGPRPPVPDDGGRMRARVLVAVIAALLAVFPAPATAESAPPVATLW